MPELRLGNFRLGQRRDSALRDDAIISARTLENFEISYGGESARLRIRNGYTRWNTNALGAPADQIYMFSDMEQNEHLLGLYSLRWYELNQVAAHEQLIDVASTARRPILQFGNRCFFWTDDDGDGLSGYWTDDTQLGSAPKAYRLGIKKPTERPTVSLALSVGNTVGVIFPPAAGSWDLNNTTTQKIATRLILASETDIDNIVISWMWTQLDLDGQIRLAIYTDSSFKPDVPFNVSSITPWEPVNQWAVTGAYNYKNMAFSETLTLPAGTYWIVIEPDQAYLSNYDHGGAPAAHFFAAFAHSIAPPANASLRWNGAAWLVDGAHYLGHAVGGLEIGMIYDYKMTYRNSTYGSESRPSDISERVVARFTRNRVTIAYNLPSDGQVDKVAVYRREVGADNSVIEIDITEDWYYVGEEDHDVLALVDSIGPNATGAAIQTNNHYCLDDIDDTPQGRRDAAILAKYAALWKGRIWIAEADSNVLHFTKVLAKDGATGLLGESAEDYVPLENKQELPVPAGIIGLRPLSNDQLAVYFEDESVWLIYGGDEALNPPSDLIIREVLTTNGLIATAGIADLDGRHIYLGRDGLYAFAGTQMLVPEYLSETNQSILDAIQRQYLQLSVVHTVGREIWVGYDSDNDGALDKMLILDLQRDVRTRQLYDRAWRTYDYGVGFNDFVVVSSGNQFRKIYAADADNAYILELESGNLDNNLPIVGLLETHDLTAEDLVMINQLDIDAYYPGSPPTYRITLTDHQGNVEVYDFDNIGGSDDIRGHRMGVRLRSPVSVRLQLEQWSTNNDELRAITLGYTTT